MAPNDLKALISAALEGDSQSATPEALAVSGPNGNGAYDFAGGADEGTYTVDDLTTSGDTPTVSGDFSVTDPDNGEEEGEASAPTYAILDGAAGANQATVTGTASAYTITKGGTDWGTIALNTATGAWTFTADAAALDALADSDSETLALTAQVSNAGGTAVTKAFTITLNGVDDVAVVTVTDATSDADGDSDEATFNVTETNASTATDIATITITSDPDTTYTKSDFAVLVDGSADDRFEVDGTGTTYTLRIKAGQTFDFDETPSADNTFTLTVTGPGGPPHLHRHDPR